MLCWKLVKREVEEFGSTEILSRVVRKGLRKKATFE